MNIKIIIVLSLALVSCNSTLNSQEKKRSLKVKSSHLFSEWILNDSIKTKVMLETGFPKVVISEDYALKYLQELITLQEAPENTSIRLWGQTENTIVSYLIKDTLNLIGQKIYIDALVADTSTIKSWKNIDMVFPLKDLPGVTEINIRDKSMIINKNTKELSNNYEILNAKFDKNIKGLYISSSLTVYDSINTTEKISGDFLLDLGAGNALFINRDLKPVENFISHADRMLLKDTTQFKPNPRTKLGILMPRKFKIGSIVCNNEFIVAMKMFGDNSEKYTGIIGNKFFAHFIVAFDYKNNKVYLKPNSDKIEILNH